LFSEGGRLHAAATGAEVVFDTAERVVGIVVGGQIASAPSAEQVGVAATGQLVVARLPEERIETGVAKPRVVVAAAVEQVIAAVSWSAKVNTGTYAFRTDNVLVGEHNGALARCHVRHPLYAVAKSIKYPF
jgi:hypothetical protein